LSQFDTEAYFDEIKNQVLSNLQGKSYDLVIGIPFDGDSGDISKLLESIDSVVESWMGVRQLIVCAGEASAQAKLRVIQETNLKLPHIEFLLTPEVSGRGTAIRTFIAISYFLEADLIVFNENMAAENGFWLDSLLSPIRGAYDMALGSIIPTRTVDYISRLLANPILETFYGCRVSDPLGGIYAISHDFIEELNHEAKFWGRHISRAGIDLWLVTRALCWNKNICQVGLQGPTKQRDLEDKTRIFQENAHLCWKP
jgi:hypothetical protein